jgi:hypothetical protein
LGPMPCLNPLITPSTEMGHSKPMTINAFASSFLSFFFGKTPTGAHWGPSGPLWGPPSKNLFSFFPFWASAPRGPRPSHLITYGRSFCPSVHPSVSPSIHLSIRLSVHLYVHLYVSPYIHPYIHPSIRPYICPHVHTYVCTYVPHSPLPDVALRTE